MGNPILFFPHPPSSLTLDLPSFTTAFLRANSPRLQTNKHTTAIMKFSAVVLAATSSTLVAAQLDQLAGLVPECATSCLATALGGLSSECGVDIACYCKPENQASIKEKSQPCLEEQ